MDKPRRRAIDPLTEEELQLLLRSKLRTARHLELRLLATVERLKAQLASNRRELEREQARSSELELELERLQKKPV